MAGFIYYRPGPGLMNISEARKIGLGYAFDGGTPAGANDIFGPDGGRGAIFADSKRIGQQSITYAPKVQTWRKLPEINNVWAGFYNDFRPTPLDLERPSFLDGKTIQLADGHSWTIPVVRRFNESVGFADNLPRSIDLDENGKWIYGPIVQKHSALWAAVGKFLDNLFDAIGKAKETDGTNEIETEYTISDELDTVALLLGANYVVSKAEIAALGLLVDDGMIFEILKIAADWQTFIEWSNSKKNELDLDTQPIADGQKED